MIMCAATRNSLVIIDEIGRGTEVEAGTAMAGAVLEDLHDRVRCRTITATHLRGLNTMATRLSGMRNLQAQVYRLPDPQGRDDDGTHDVVFTYRMVPGVATESYAFEIAMWAGLPQAVVDRARVLLTKQSGDRQ